MKKLTIVSILIVAFLSLTAVASADHSWNGYHWGSDNLSPSVKDKTSSPLYNVTAGVDEWTNLGTPISPQLTDGKKGNITVSEGSSTFWLGLARVFVEEGHITKGEVKLNTRLLGSYGAAAADHVLCQELGHVLGLDHNRTEGDTCMNDQATLGSVTSPNAHDAEMLTTVYNHTDQVSSGGPGNGKGNGKGPKKQGRWVTVHVFPAP